MKNSIKRIFIATCLFLVFSLELWSQNFELPVITNTVYSVEEAVRKLIGFARDIGTPEYNGAWNYSPELFQSDIIAYLNNVLENMDYASLRDYTRLIRTNIDRIDRQAISRNTELEFERFLKAIYPNSDYEVRDMQNEYRTKPFPFTLRRDENTIAELAGQLQEYEQNLRVYQTQLDALPTIDQLNNRLQEIRSELLSPNVARNSRLKRQLEEEAAAIERQKIEIEWERGRLTRLISDTRNQIISSVSTSFYDFYEWEKFFNNENTCLRDFFILKETKQKLYDLLDHIPQGQVQGFRSRLDNFCSEWGI